MSKRVDDLFKKLEDHSLPPPQRAWDTISGNLSKKNRTIIWLRVAAVIVATVAGIGVLRWQRGGDTEPPTLAKAPIQTTQPQAHVANRDSTAMPLSAETTPTKTFRKRQTEKVTTTKTVPANESLIAQQSVSEERVVPLEATETTQLQTASGTAKKKSITLVFDLPTMPAKDQAPATSVAAGGDEEVKRTAFQKAVAAANDLRSGDVLGNLREAKDELFALDFRKDKTKKNQ